MYKKIFTGIAIGFCILTSLIILITDFYIFETRIMSSLDGLKLMVCLVFIPISICFNIVLHCIVIKAINKLIGDDGNEFR